MTRKHLSSRATRVALVAVLAASGYAVANTSSAQADSAPAAKDVVGVGSDIVQNSLDFLADGDAQSHPGYNTAGNRYRLYSFDATADANGRNAFVDPALSPTAKVLNPTVVLRAGTSPVQRPNGGGAGITALLADGQNGVSTNAISFVRSPNLPTAANQVTAGGSNGTGGNLGSYLHTIQFADDKQVMATATTTNAPATFSVTDLAKIYSGVYKTWGDIPGYTGPAPSATIVALLPQNGAGVQKVFLNALKPGNAGSSITVSPTVRLVQQNDPTTITSLSDAERPNAIVPFPVARYTLLNSHYFRDPNTAYGVGQSAPPALDATGISLERGTGAFEADLPYYVIFRESDIDGPAWQPGGTLSWVRTLFYNPSDDGPEPYVNTAPAIAILQANGLTPKYDDLGAQTSG